MIIEENKADIISISFVDLLTNLTYYTEEQRKQILVTVLVDNFLKVKPEMSQAHRVRTVKQNYYLQDKGAFNLTEDGKINIDKVVPPAKEMLKEISRIQLDNDIVEAKNYVNKHFIWTNEMEIIGQKLQK